jgi:hypothetical protein
MSGYGCYDYPSSSCSKLWFSYHHTLLTILGDATSVMPERAKSESPKIISFLILLQTCARVIENENVV